MRISRIENVPLREMWENEATDFTPWLADEDNLELLSDSIGVNLERPTTEVEIGSFNADIKAFDDEGSIAIIENQLNRTDHDHLGKLITYSAGRGAKYIIWIVKSAREEHQQAIQWLNEISNFETGFFLIEIELLRIDGSAVAPRFNVIEKPNEWAKEMKSRSKSSNEVSNTRLRQLEFFEKLREAGPEKAPNIKSWRKPSARHWFTVGIGRSGVYMAVVLNSKEQTIAVELYIKDDKHLYFQLKENRLQIEEKIGSELDWRELPNKKASRILLFHNGDLFDDTDHEQMIDWALETLDRFSVTFGEELRRMQ